jgi:uncharacterized protein (DUF58 family)
MSTYVSFSELFDEQFLSAVQQFSLRLQQLLPGGRLAEQKTKARGQGLEFTDFKPYVAGDDLRAVDWSIYRRLGRLFVRVFEEQQAMPVYLLVDLSKSMFVEKQPRIHAALRAALALAAVSLTQHDAVRLFSCSAELKSELLSVSGKQNLIRIAQQMAELRVQTVSQLAAAIFEFGQLPARQGLLILFSDFFDDAGLEPVLEALSGLRHKVLIIQLTQPWDSNPYLYGGFEGELRLQDCETSDYAEINVTAEVVTKYQRLYQEFNQQLADYALQSGSGFLQLDASADVLTQLSSLFNSGTLRL